MSEFWYHILSHTIEETISMLPFLFAAYLLIEFLERRSGHGLEKALSKAGRGGPFIGALLGLVPQCGFSVAAANFYAARLISPGTLAAVFLSTSDEAIPLLLASPGHFGDLLALLTVKFILAVGAGTAIDIFWRKPITLGKKQKRETADHCHSGILRPALGHALKVFLFLFLFTLALNLLLAALGEERIARLFLTGSFWQPVLGALVGLIPNCAASVLLTQMYLEGGLSFGTAIAGLSTGAGLGLLVLLRTNRPMKDNLILLGLLFLFAVSAGLLLQLAA